MQNLALLFLATCMIFSCSRSPKPAPLLTTNSCAIELIILGTGQDAGAPQIGNPNDKAWAKPSHALTASALAVVDHKRGQRYLFEATPHITQQLQFLDNVAPVDHNNLGLDGIFITHAHIGHYAGLIFLGREAAGTHALPVYAMPRMAEYLTANGPWQQLITIENITLRTLQHQSPVSLSSSLQITPHLVPHRDEYSETVGYEIIGPDAKILFIPDIDSWEKWETEFNISLVDMIDNVDNAFLDATFFDDHELPNRDMSEIPHPRVTDTMNRLQHLPLAKRANINFIHYNHTNPIRFSDSEPYKQVKERGFSVASQGQTVCLEK